MCATVKDLNEKFSTSVSVPCVIYLTGPFVLVTADVPVIDKRSENEDSTFVCYKKSSWRNVCTGVQ